MLTVVPDPSDRDVVVSAGSPVAASLIDEIVRERTDPETGERRRFSSAILPPWARKTPKVTEVLPLLYLHGLSSGDFVPALGQFLGSSTVLSSSAITKLTEQWKADQRAFAARDLSAVDYVYLWELILESNARVALGAPGVRTRPQPAPAGNQCWWKIAVWARTGYREVSDEGDCGDG